MNQRHTYIIAVPNLMMGSPIFAIVQSEPLAARDREITAETVAEKTGKEQNRWVRAAIQVKSQFGQRIRLPQFRRKAKAA
jgi:hypothetical protein